HRARGIDGEDRDLVPEPGEVGAEGLDEAALPHAGDAADADAEGPARAGKQPAQHGLPELRVIGAGALDQRDRPGEDRAVPGAHAPHVLVDGEAAAANLGHRSTLAARAMWFRRGSTIAPPRQSRPSLPSRSWSSRRAASLITVPGPKISAAPACLSSS